MSWLEYALRIAGTDGPKAMAQRTGLDGPHMSKWKAGTVPGPSVAAQFARGYGRPVLEAFIAAEFLTAEEAKVRPSAAPDYTRLTNDELLELVRTRMREEGEGHADSPAATKEPDSGPVLKAVASGGATPAEAEQASEQAARSKSEQDAARKEMERKLAEKEKEES